MCCSILLQHVFVVTILLQHIILVTMRIGCNNVKIKYLLLQQLRNVVTQIFVATMHGSTWLHLAPLGSFMFLLNLYRLLLTLFWLSSDSLLTSTDSLPTSTDPLLTLYWTASDLPCVWTIENSWEHSKLHDVWIGLDWITDHHYS